MEEEHKGNGKCFSTPYFNQLEDGGRRLMKSRGQKDFFIYLKMFSLLSFNWIFGIVTWFIPHGDEAPEWCLKLKDIFIFLFVLFTAANGIFICCIFTFNRRIWGLYKKCFPSWIVKSFKKCQKRSRKFSQMTLRTQESYLSRRY